MEWKKGWQDRAWLWLVKLDRERRNTDDSFKTTNRTRMIFMKMCELALKNDYVEDGKLVIPLSVSALQESLGFSRSVLISAFKDLQTCGAIVRIDGEKTVVPSKTIINYIDNE